ncbi:MAG: PHP domain-containing protein, partial [Rikenellaceae bacterium]|nr:PHP domain-containing protein [Rikenellaceae bacterium]
MHPFVHLHTHTEYSLLDGIAKISELVDKAMADGMPGIAITDHANMFGVAEFVHYIESKNRELGTNFKPIIGCEVYVARRGMAQKSGAVDFAGYHLLLLAKNQTGYRNLLQIVSRSWTEGYYIRPRTDKATLERYHEGLVCCSACIGGEVAQHILHNDLASAEHTAKWYKSVFGEDYYFELHRHKPNVERANHDIHKLEQKVNNQLIALSEKLGIKLICANDIHFVNEEDAEAQDTLLCINSNKRYNDDSRLIFSKQEWLKTTAEMNELFGDIPEALENTIEIFNKVEHYSIDHAPLLPKPLLPEGVDEVEHLARLAFEGAYERFGKP